MIIKSKDELNNILAEEKKNIFGRTNISSETKFRKSFKVQYYYYLSNYRKFEYLSFKRDNSSFLFHHIYAFTIKCLTRKLNTLSVRIGVEFGNNIDTQVTVCHPNVILNGAVGKGCVFHGNNVLGNKCTGSNETPILGNNVDVGIGAIIIGNVHIADNCIIGAGAVVTKSFDVPGSIIAGVPAKKIN